MIGYITDTRVSHHGDAVTAIAVKLSAMSFPRRKQRHRNRLQGTLCVLPLSFLLSSSSLLFVFSGIFILDALLIYHRIDGEDCKYLFLFKKKKYYARNIVDTLVASRLENKFCKYSRER